MRFRKLAAVVPFLLSLVFALPALAQTSAGTDTTRASARRASLGPAPRTGWTIGIGGGYGMGGPHAENSPEQEPGGTTHFRTGFGVGEKAVLGVEYMSWTASPTDTTTFDFSAAGPSLTWYWNNVYARGMVGWGMGKAQFEVPSGTGHTLVEMHDDGFAYLAAVGWEWRFRHRFAFAPEVGGVYASLDKELAYHTIWASLSLNLYY